MIDRLLRREEVENRVGLKRSSIYREMRAGRFPLPLKIGRALCAGRPAKSRHGWPAGHARPAKPAPHRINGKDGGPPSVAARDGPEIILKSWSYYDA